MIFVMISLSLGEAKQEMSVYVSKPYTPYGFPYFHFFTGMFYGFILGAIAVAILVYIHIDPEAPFDSL